MKYLGTFKPINNITRLHANQLGDAMVYIVNSASQSCDLVFVQVESPDGTAWSSGCVIKLQTSVDGQAWYDSGTQWTAYGFSNSPVNVSLRPFMRLYVSNAGSGDQYAVASVVGGQE